MISNIWKISVRNILKHRIYSSINVFGLALGFTAFILISLFIQYELGWDQSNAHYDRIYRVQRHMVNAKFAIGGNDISPHTRAITAQLLEKQFPEFEKITLIQESYGKFLSVTEDRQVYTKTGIFADSCYFDVFSYQFIEGTSQGALNDPFSVIISMTMADKLFPGEKALGKRITVEKKLDLKVTGVYTDLPENTSIRPDYIISFTSLAQINGTKRDSPYSGDCMTFALLKPGVDDKYLEGKIRKVFAVFKDLEFEELQLCPLNMIYLDYNGHGDYYIALIIYGMIGLFILIMSAFNYINLTTANASGRNKEVGVKKVCGSNRFELILQFLCETVITSILALVFAFALAKLFLPLFNEIVNKQIVLTLYDNWKFIGITVLISLAIGFLSGIYPALYLSSHKILSLFKGDVFDKRRGKYSLKKVLVISQFAISVFMIIITISFYMQIRYLFQKDIGFTKENILYTKMEVSKSGVSFDQLRNRVLAHPEIISASMSRHIPFVSFGGGMTNWEGNDPREEIICRFNDVSYDFVKTMGIQIIKGRDFSRDFPGDIGNSCLINETAARNFGWDNPIGKRLNNNRLTVVGVVNDFIYKDMHNDIEPTVMVLAPEEISGSWTFAFRVDPRNQQKASAVLNEEFKSSFPNDPFEFNDLPTYFANENTIQIYHSVIRTILFFTVFNIFLAMIGLLGLVSYSVMKRTKEIGVRKINGSTSINIFYLLSREYFILLFLSLLIAFPSAWWTYEQIPSANKLHIQPWIFGLAALILFVIILITTSYQTLKAAFQNPVEALRYE
ncbi:MAG TPA: ABC transporter permease [Prolixibacteraceae bacterium]|nr:ABC transporter permease [Prolixibacteraceae bacterium]